MIDLHAHILPGIDDGPADWQEALEMLRVAERDGITTMVATSHQEGRGGYANTNATLIDLAQKLQNLSREAGLSIRILPGGEVLASPDLVTRIEQNEALTLANGGRYLLLEFPASEVPRYSGQLVFELQVRGITPIIAHAERNAGFAADPDALSALIDAGALVQLTAASFSRRVSLETRALAMLFVTHNMAHVLASDAHSLARRPPILGRYAARLAACIGETQASVLVRENPACIVRGDVVTTSSVLPFTRKSRRRAWRLARRLGRRKGLFGSQL